MKIFEEISFSSPPVVLAAWPGMGNVGLIAVDFLRKKMNARLFAEIDMSPFFIPDSIVVKNGIAQFPDIPTSLFYHTKDPDLIIFESDAQVSGRDGIAVIKMFLDVITRFQVKRIFTFAAFAQPMSYRNPSQVLVAGNDEALLEKLGALNVIPMPDGYIAGLNGLLLGVAASRKIQAGCLLGTIPSYAMNFAYPKASLELLRTVSGVLGFSLDTAELDEGVGEMNQQLALIEERIREFFPSVNKENDDEIAHVEEEKVPHVVMEKIERLFNEARLNRSKATELKRELDRWNLFELYENRFLDLFEEDKKNRKK
ncbi:MAG: PAC2 family protein [Chitinispirillaceae bacterium]|nr:PAC2 family protein [Chitinispirillaceae bacterium]